MNCAVTIQYLPMGVVSAVRSTEHMTDGHHVTGSEFAPAAPSAVA